MNNTTRTLAAGAFFAASLASFTLIPYDIDCPDGAAYCEATFVARDGCEDLAMRGGTSTCDAGPEVASSLACAKSTGAVEAWECLPRMGADGGCDAVCSVQIPAAREDDARAVLDNFDAQTDPNERAEGASSWSAR